ncbi:DUF262 domain-containing protein [Acinetobacter wuhouensis]|uniref:DUF262 domain-containing protein n=1 Tax=Acinetobacter wuhouensis TaxID=1879050 RepID=A0A3G2T2Y5_9GAMM|nr:DUF262 domain-containing protein [Acinetobacter wuhouensis]AYO54620.1 DUF262 domain-containing protein [Acinetobacter wuhouensis]
MLLQNEKLNFDYANAVDNQLTDREINAKYQEGELRILTEQGRYPLQNIVEIMGTMNLNPEYQRRRVWSNEQKSRLIESFIMNIPVPPVFLYEISFSKYEVMDGLQRLSTLFDFYNGNFQLEGLEIWSELNGRNIYNLPENIKSGIDRRYISTVVILNETAKNKNEEQFLKKFVFERLNTGGTKLTPQETRNALFDGPMNKLCISIAYENEIFKNIFEIPDANESLLENALYKRMEDVELVLRFFAYRQLSSFKVSKISDILDNYLEKANIKYNPEILEKLEKLFNDTIFLVYKIFDDKAFRFKSLDRNKDFVNWSKPSKMIYDPIMFILSEYSQNIEVRNKLIENRNIINERFEKVMNDNPNEFSGRNNNKADVLRRIELFKGIFDL